MQKTPALQWGRQSICAPDGLEYKAEALKRSAGACISKAGPNEGSILDVIRNCPSMDGST